MAVVSKSEQKKKNNFSVVCWPHSVPVEQHQQLEREREQLERERERLERERNVAVAAVVLLLIVLMVLVWLVPALTSEKSEF